jgi:hypothetical protein
MSVLVGGVQTPYQVVMITRQLLDHRVLPRAISYMAHYTEDMGALVAQSVEIAAPDAQRNVMDYWISPQPEAVRLTRRSFVEAGLADLTGPDIAGYGRVLGHGWLLDEFTLETISASPPSSAMATFRCVQQDGDILIACRLDPWTESSVHRVFEEHNVRHIQTMET